MHKPQKPPERIGGTGFHVGDSHIWTEIYYLDSPTNYREYLPRNISKQEGRLSDKVELVMLDDKELSAFSSLRAKGLMRPLLVLVQAVSNWSKGSSRRISGLFHYIVD